MTGQPASAMFGSLRHLCDAGLGLVQNRVELFAVELREEKARYIQILLWAAAAVFAGIMSVALITLTLIIAFWETARLPVLIGLSVFYCSATIAAGLVLRNRLGKTRLPFADSISELKKDREWLQRSNSASSKTGNGP